MNQYDDIVSLLESIQSTQLEEARLAKARWRTAVVLFVSCCIVAAPAILRFLHQFLVDTF
jgi:hypothetical protein